MMEDYQANFLKPIQRASWIVYRLGKVRFLIQIFCYILGIESQHVAFDLGQNTWEDTSNGCRWNGTVARVAGMKVGQRRYWTREFATKPTEVEEDHQPAELLI